MTNRICVAATLASIFVYASCCAAQSTVPQTSSTVRMENGVKLECIADGFGFPEGPVWLREGGLLFSDVHNGIICHLDHTGKPERWYTFTTPGNSNGLILDWTGTKLYACGNGEKVFLEF